MLMILVGTRPDLCRNKRHSLSFSDTIPANFALRPDRSQTIGHDGSSCGSRACTLGQDSVPLATRVRSTLLACLCLFQNIQAQGR